MDTALEMARPDGRPATEPAPLTERSFDDPSSHHFAATRSVARKLALQALYRWQLNDGPWQDLVHEFGDAEDMPKADREYFRELVEGVWRAREALDTSARRRGWIASPSGSIRSSTPCC